jgi:hypothetical protein
MKEINMVKDDLLLIAVLSSAALMLFTFSGCENASQGRMGGSQSAGGVPVVRDSNPQGGTRQNGSGNTSADGSGLPLSVSIGGNSGSNEGKSSSYYVSAVFGSDKNPGTESEPFKTLAKATSVLTPGCTLYVMNGTYRETLCPPSGSSSMPVKIEAYKDDKPIISGADPLRANWVAYKRKIYKTPYTGMAFEQLFVDGRMMTVARWPKANADPDKVLDMRRAVTTGGNEYSIRDPHLPAGDWAGGRIYIWPGAGWISFVREIKDYSPGNSLTVTRLFQVDDPHAEEKPYCPKAGCYYFIFGKLAGLDAPNEWVIEHSCLYLYAPDGKRPEQHSVEYRARDYGIHLKGKSYVEVSGISLFAAAITMENAEHCIIDGCDQQYHEYFDDTDGYRTTFDHHLNYVSGDNNVWKNSEIAYSAGDGIRLDGSNNVVDNMLIHDVDFSGGWFAGVMGQPGRNKDNVPDAADTNPKIISTCNNVQVSHCTIYNCGRNAILHHKTGTFDILYNDLSNASKLVNDCGLTSTFGTDGKGSVIAYNWFHDNVGRYTVGIYLDCYNRDFIIHNNVIWNCSWAGIQLNGYSHNNLVYNNTIWGCGAAFRTYSYASDVPDQRDTKIFNNLFEGSALFVTGSLAPWLSNNLQGHVHGMLDAHFVPSKSSAAVDAGATVTGVNNPYQGKSPDLGAYEYGGGYWKPGYNASLAKSGEGKGRQSR